MADSDSHSRRELGPSAFLLRDIVAEGGHGEVWSAIQVSLKRVVAVKRVRRKWYEDRSADNVRLIDASFRKEALVTSRLDHPNIVPVYDFGSDREGHPLLAMKLIEGAQWSRMLAEDRGRLDPPEYLARHLAILISVAHAVGFAHSRGVIHRDLKPGQVMVGRFGEVFLMDWGLAVVFEDHKPTSAAAGLTKPISLQDAMNPAGTVGYMAPEQTESTAARLGPWTDIWLLGGCLYAVLTGTRPYDDEVSHDAMVKARRGIVDPPERRAPDYPIPPELSQLCMRALSPEIGNRPAGTRDFIRAIEDYLSGTHRRDEARRLTEQAQTAIQAGISSYEELSSCDNQLTRACSLWPDYPDARSLQQHLLGAFARAAVDNGDLGLARVQTARLADTAERAALELRIDRKQRLLQRQATERRIAIAACFVLLIVSGLLGSMLIDRAAKARVAAEQERAETARKQGEIIRARENAKASAEQARRANEISSLYGAEARLARELADGWKAFFGVPPALAWTTYDRNRWARADHDGARRLFSEIDDWETTRRRLTARGEKLAPPLPSFSYGAGVLSLAAAAESTNTGKAYGHFSSAVDGSPRYYMARIGMATAAFRGGDAGTARRILDEAAAIILSEVGFRGDFQRALILGREALIQQSRGVALAPHSVVVESRPGGKNPASYEELGGGPWRDTNKPAEWAKSAAVGTTVDQAIGSRMVRFYNGQTTLETDLPAAARLHPQLEAPGRYHVYVTWPIAASAFPVVCTVRHAHGETSVSLVQDGWGFQGPSNANLWTSLGEYEIGAGPDQWVELRAPRGVKPVSRAWNGQFEVDAVLFSPQPLDSCTTQPRLVAESVEEECDSFGWYYDMAKAREAATNAGKGIFLFLSGGSSEMNVYYREVFADRDVTRAITGSYIPVSVRAYGNTETAWAYRDLAPGSAVMLDAAGNQRAVISPVDMLVKERVFEIVGKEGNSDGRAR